jgi:hypothetical protein
MKCDRRISQVKGTLFSSTSGEAGLPTGAEGASAEPSANLSGQ